MDKCSIFITILHIFSCCRSVLKRLTMGKRKHCFHVGFVLYANRKKKDKNVVVGYLLSKMLALFLGNSYGYVLAYWFQSQIVSLAWSLF